MEFHKSLSMYRTKIVSKNSIFWTAPVSTPTAAATALLLLLLLLLLLILQLLTQRDLSSGKKTYKLI
jgi:hypothetical protein